MLLPRPIAVLSKAIKHSRHIHHHPTLPSSTIQLSRHIAFSTKELRSKSPLRRPQSTSKMSNKPIPKLPPGSWDSHVHVIDEENYPFAPTHPYRPKKASLDSLLSFSKTLGTTHLVLVSISVYGTDNTLLLDSLRQLNGRGRGIVTIDPLHTPDTELDKMHALGVRGVRLNLKSSNATLSKKDFTTTLHQYAARLRPRNWVLQLYIPLSDLASIATTLPTLGIEVVLDHLGSPSKTTPPRLQNGYTALMDLLLKRQIWVKLSGVDLFPDLPELDEYVREILRVGPTQVVWASDWPHTPGVAGNPGGDRHVAQDFRAVDDEAAVARWLEWCGGDEGLIEKIFVENPRRLWRYGEGNE